jgi:hypothetical protein
MSIYRLLCCGVLVVGASLFGLACSPTTVAEAQQAPELQEGQPEGAFCGGIAGFPCAEGLVCVDDPKDDCDPDQGGADCGGICRRERSNPSCTGREPGQKYISRDPNQCAAIRFFCAEGFSPFFNDCGCGCQKDRKSCDYRDPNLSYVSKDPLQCLAITFECTEGATQFFNDCGCGCRTQNGCNDNNPRKSYISLDPAECTVINFLCIQGTQPFTDRCGCGCEVHP